MTDDKSSAPSSKLPPMSSSESAQFNTNLAIDRTVMAADRSLMAWVRTALSMISFGFTIYKLLEGFAQSGEHFRRATTPRDIGLFLTGLGTVAVVMGTIEYWYRFKTLRERRAMRLVQPSFVMALIMSAAGLFIFGGILIRAL
jgi:putative membrane protein